jgi:hypothetical protein
VGPTTVLVSVIAVVLVQLVSVTVLSSPPEFLQSYEAPILFTVVLVTAAVLVFALVARTAANPVGTYRRIALVALFVSFGPDIPIGLGMTPGGTWALAIIFMVMHVAAWAVTVTMLTRLPGISR